MTETVLQVSDLTVSYGTQRVLTQIDLSVTRGEWFCLLGPNGVGKSTLLHCVAGRIAPGTGELLICGHSILTQPTQAKSRLGFACAPEQLPGLLTGRQCLEVYAIAKNLTDIDADVIDLARELKFVKYLDACVDTYSLGTRQKLCVLLALLGDPQLVVLDEAFNGLDPASSMALKLQLQARLAQKRCGVLLATHSLDIVEHHAHKAALLLDGRIAREWNEEEMSSIRKEGANGFEVALAAASIEP